MPLTKFRSMGVFLLTTLVVSASLYFLFDQFLELFSKEIVGAWYHGEIVSLQEGQVLPAIVKNQNVMLKSPFIKAVQLIEVSEPDRSLFAIGTLDRVPQASDFSSRTGEIKVTRIGFLRHLTTVHLPTREDLYMVYEIQSNLLVWGYLLSISIGILSVLYIFFLTKKLVAEETEQRQKISEEIAKRLNHDLKSPLHRLASLNLKVKRLDEHIFQQIETALNRFRVIIESSQKLSSAVEMKGQLSAIDEETALVPLAAVIRETVLDKRLEFHNSNIEIDVVTPKDVHGIFAKANAEELRRHITNLLQNSSEAIQGHGKITVSLGTDDSTAVILIQDNGMGIPKSIRSKIGNLGFSHGKPQGTGLGVHYAKNAIELWKGQFQIISEESKGTTIKIKLPIEKKPSWFQSEVCPDPESKIIVVDDDPTIFLAWKKLFRDRQDDILFFANQKDFKAWFWDKGQFEEKVTFLLDYHLGESVTGLDLIENLGIQKESTLVTSAYLDSQILDRVQLFEMGLMPKTFLFM